MHQFAFIVLLTLSLSPATAQTQNRSPNDAITEAQHREILDEPPSPPNMSHLERYAAMVLLPLGGVLLLVWMLRANRHD